MYEIEIPSDFKSEDEFLDYIEKTFPRFNGNLGNAIEVYQKILLGII